MGGCSALTLMGDPRGSVSWKAHGADRGTFSASPYTEVAPRFDYIQPVADGIRVKGL